MFNVWQDTANQWFPVRFVDDTDLLTGVTGIQASSMTLARSKAGGSGYVAIAAGNFISHEIGSGSYWVRVNASSEFDTVGPMVFRCMASAGFSALSLPVAVNVSEIADTGVTPGSLWRQLLAWCNGWMDKDEGTNVVEYLERDNATVSFTNTYTGTTRRRS